MHAWWLALTRQAIDGEHPQTCGQCSPSGLMMQAQRRSIRILTWPFNFSLAQVGACTPRGAPLGVVQPYNLHRDLPYIDPRVVSCVQTHAQQLNFEPQIHVLYLICW